MTDFSEPNTPAMQPPSCESHTENSLNCTECSELRFAFYRTIVDDGEINESDDDGDDDEIVIDPGSFDGGYGNGSYYQHAMRKD